MWSAKSGSIKRQAINRSLYHILFLLGKSLKGNFEVIKYFLLHSQADKRHVND